MMKQGKIHRLDLIGGGRVEFQDDVKLKHELPKFRIYNTSGDDLPPIVVDRGNMTTLANGLFRIQGFAQRYQAHLKYIQTSSTVINNGIDDTLSPTFCMNQEILYTEGNDIVRAFVNEYRNQVSLTIQAHRISYSDPTKLVASSGIVNIDLYEDLEYLYTFVRKL